MLDLLATWLDAAIYWFGSFSVWEAAPFWKYDFNLRAILATLLVCFICASLGSLVVGNRMSFFSDALAHCAFAGVGLGLMFSLFFSSADTPSAVVQQRITLIMVCFGVGIGVLIAFVREQTGLASDTVIGVFYASAIGLGAVFSRLARGQQYFNIEDFIFGNPTSAKSWQVVLLIGLAVLTAVFLTVMYNWLILTSANPSLAHSRQTPVRLCQYSFIVLLALMVNLSQQITGTLLINGLLIVPAATAANLAKNLRQMFWYSIAIAVFVGLTGNLLSWEFNCYYLSRTPPANSRFTEISIGTSGTIVVLCGILFALSMPLGRWLRRLPNKDQDEPRAVAQS